MVVHRPRNLQLSRRSELQNEGRSALQRLKRSVRIKRATPDAPGAADGSLVVYSTVQSTWICGLASGDLVCQATLD